MKLRGNEEYCPEEIESKELWSTMMILDPFFFLKIKKENMSIVKDHNVLGTYDG
jgi:hypothetical protein